MKKTLLSLAVVASAFSGQSQVTCAGVSPANIVGNYEHTWADPAGADWATPDYLIPGNFIEDTLMLVDTGEPGLNPQGNPIAQEACAPLINDLSGKIAVIYRNTCEFGFKALQAENAGAIGVIIINRDDEAIGMGGGAEGLNVTIPVFMMTSSGGATIVAEMGNGPVVMFLGNKVGAFANDVGAGSAEALISPYGGSSTLIDNGFEVGLQMYNYGANPQSNITITANIDGPGGNVYNQVINAPTMNTGDTLSIFTGNTYAFPPFDLGGIGAYATGDYTLTYTLDMGVADDSDFDNVLTSTFTVNDNVISLSGINASDEPKAGTYPSNSTTEYQSCMFFLDANASSLALTGITFVPFTDTAVAALAGEEIFLNLYEWNDTWVDLADPLFTGGANNDWFTQLNQIGYETYYPASDNETGQPAYVPLTAPLVLVDNQRYLFCLQSFNPEVGFGYDGDLNYDGNQGITAMPVAPVYVDDTWFTGGWVGPSAASMALHVADASNIGLDEVSTLEGKAFPNPANDVVTVSVNANGNANLTVTDLAGKIAMSNAITLENGNAKVNIDALDAGVYVFNVELENGLTSQFNVVKK